MERYGYIYDRPPGEPFARPVGMIEQADGEWVKYADAQATVEALQRERDALKTEVYDQKKLAEKYWKEAREADNKRVASAAALRDERDRLAELVGQAQPHVCSLLCPSVKARHELWTHTKLCLNMQAALTPAGGGQE